MTVKVIGKCPKCDSILTKEDIDDIRFRGRSRQHHAYVCLYCKYIIGFAASLS